MDKYEFLKLCSEDGGITSKNIDECDQNIIEEYNRLVHNGDITVFHGFICLVEDILDKDEEIYALVPYTGSYQELQQDDAFSEHHYFRAQAKKEKCDLCGRIYFKSKSEDKCPYCTKSSQIG